MGGKAVAVLFALFCLLSPASRGQAESCLPPQIPDSRLQFLLPLAGGACLALIEEEVGTRPVASVWRLADDWRRLAGVGAALDGHGWVGAAASGARVIAVADGLTEGPDLELTLFTSEDGGASWSLPLRLPKPFYLAVLKSLRLEPDGSATLSLVLEEDYGSAHAPGTFCYRVERDGRGWSGPFRLPEGAGEAAC